MRVFTWRRLALPLTAVVVIGAQAVTAQTWDVGEIPNTVTAVLSGGTLTISGAGAMKDYESSMFGRTEIPWYDRQRTITSVVIGNGITHIGDNAFYDCTRLSSIDIPNSVKAIGSSAFSGCTGLKSIALPNGVDTIGDNAFYGCTGITSVIFGDSMKYIGFNAFAKCTGLASIVIPNGVTHIGDAAFEGCAFTSVVIPQSVEYILGGTFRYCAKLTSIEVAPDNPNFLSESGILFNKSKTNIMRYPSTKQGENYDIPNGVETISAMAFQGCTGLKSVTIPDGVISIGSSAFAKCTGLTSIVIPNSVKSLDWFVFDECTGLASIIIGSGVTTIGNDAFADCGKLKSITSLNPVPPGFSIFTAFDDVDKTAATVYVPAGSLNAYKSAKEWKDFANIIELDNSLTVSSRDRVTPSSASVKETAIATPAAALTAELTAGPNPITRHSAAAVSFVRKGKGIESATLYVYDASGNLVRKVSVRDKSPNNSGRRAVGSWDLRDSKGRAVPEGTYAVKGTVNAADGKKERVSLILGVR